MPARALASLRKERNRAGDVRSADVVVLDLVAFERDGQKSAHRDRGSGRASQFVDSPIAAIEGYKGRHQPDCGPFQPALHAPSAFFQSASFFLERNASQLSAAGLSQIVDELG